jgi:hypothetical protein
MSIKALEAIFTIDPSTVTKGEWVVLVYLGWRTHAHTGKAWPTVSTIARETPLTRRGVQKALLGLKQKDLIVPDGTTAWGSIKYRPSIPGLNGERAVPTAGLERQEFDGTPSSQSAPNCEPSSQSSATTQTANCEPSSRGGRTGRRETANPVRPKGIKDNRKKREERSDDSTAASPLPSGEAASQPSASVTARSPQSGFTATAQLVQALVQRSESKPDPEPQPTGPGRPRTKGHGSNGHGSNGRSVAAAPASLRVLHDRHQQLQRVAAQTFDALGLYADPLALEADFNQRVETLGIELGAVDVMDYLWKAKRERRTQAYAHAVS